MRSLISVLRVHILDEHQRATGGTDNGADLLHRR